MEFKKLEIESETSWFKRNIMKRHILKTFIYIVVGAIVGFLYFFFTEGKHQDIITAGDILKSTLIGGFFGFFITNLVPEINADILQVT